MKPLVVGILVLASCGGGSTTKTSYESLGALKQDQEKAGWVLLGQFDEKWPATIRNERTADDEISFSLKNGARHGYPGYSGYTLKVTRLEAADGHEVVVVFRSKEKR